MYEVDGRMARTFCKLAPEDDEKSREVEGFGEADNPKLSCTVVLEERSDSKEITEDSRAK